MRNRAWTVAAGAMALVVMAGVARGDAISAWESLFGQDARDVLALRDGKKQAAFAKRLLESAPGVKDDPAFQTLLYAKAYEFGMMNADGYVAAVAAATALGQEPQQADAANEKLLATRELQYRVATVGNRKAAAGDYVDQALVVSAAQVRDGHLDEAMTILQKARSVADSQAPTRSADVIARVRNIQARQVLAKRLDALREVLRNKPNDAKAATELVELSLVEVDKPADCSTYVGAVDEALRNVVDWAGKKPGELSETDALALSDWYRGKTVKATDIGKANAWRRVRDLCEWVAAAHEKKDEVSLKAEFGVKDAEKALAALVIVQGAGDTINFLTQIDVAKDVVGGSLSVDKARGVLVVGPGTEVRLNYRPPEEYDLRWTFSRDAGEQWILFYLQEGDRPFAVSFGNGIGVAGKALTKYPWETGRMYATVVRVRKGGITILVDGKEVVAYKTDFKEFKIDPEGAQPISFTGCACSLSVQKLELVEVTGHGRNLPRSKRTVEATAPK